MEVRGGRGGEGMGGQKSNGLHERALLLFHKQHAQTTHTHTHTHTHTSSSSSVLLVHWRT